MATSYSAGVPRGPNSAFRALRGQLSPGEFAAAVRRAAREIGERVCCDARYIGRVEAGEIRCPNYAYERVFIHMFPGRTLTDLGFEPRHAVRGRRSPPETAGGRSRPPRGPSLHDTDDPEESDVLRRAFMTGGSAALASLASLGRPAPSASAAPQPPAPLPALPPLRPGGQEATAVQRAVRDIRLLDDRYGADTLYQSAGAALRTAYALLDARPRRQVVADRLSHGAGELAISVGWLAHDSGRTAAARQHYAEALATARVSADAALEAHAFCNTAFLARDQGHPGEAVRAAQAGQQAARGLGSHRLLALLALREAAGSAGLGDRSGCEQALGRAHTLFGRGTSETDPEWMTFFNEAEMASQEAKCWATLGEYGRATACVRRALGLQRPHFARNIALYSAELAGYLTHQGRPDEAAAAGNHAADLLGQVRSTRITGLLTTTGAILAPHRGNAEVDSFLPRLPPPRAA